MGEYLSYDIHILGLQDPSKAGRHKFAGVMERLTGRIREEFENEFPSPVSPVFQSLGAEKAQKTVDSLSTSGILVEIRPTNNPPVDPDAQDDENGTQRCPACNSVQPAMSDECAKCGVVFKKYERELLVKMQKDHTLEQAMTKAMQVREEWLQRATQLLEKKPLPKNSAKEFAAILLQDEVPFLRLNSAEGPLLMTSRRLISENEANNFISIPYEMVAEVDYGRGHIVTKKTKSRLQLTFHSPLPITHEEELAKISWHLDKESTFDKDVVFDWGYARNFICGSCGERELDYRTENHKVKCRCMHCATDHEIDLAECVAVPLISE